MTKLVGRLLATVALLVRFQTSQKYKMGELSKEDANTLKPAKTYTKKNSYMGSRFSVEDNVHAAALPVRVLQICKIPQKSTKKDIVFLLIHCKDLWKSTVNM